MICSNTFKFSDPYLASIYPVYSLLFLFTRPYVDSDIEVPTKLEFKIDVDFIPEGESDHVQVLR